MSTPVYFDESATRLLESLREAITHLTDTMNNVEAKPIVDTKSRCIPIHPNGCSSTACIKWDTTFSDNCSHWKTSTDCQKFVPYPKSTMNIDAGQVMILTNKLNRAMDLLRQWVGSYKTNSQEEVSKATEQFLLSE